MPEYPQPGADQRSQQHFVIFDRFKGLNTQSARTGLPNDQLAWLENLQPLAENKLLVVPAPAAAFQSILETMVLAFYAAINNQDYAICFTTAGSGWYINFTNGTFGQFAPDNTFSSAPDCTTWQGQRILINDSVAGYCTWDGSAFVRAGGVSPNIEVTNGGANYGSPPTVTIFDSEANGTGATGVAQIADGSVVSITLTNAGTNWTLGSNPKIDIFAGSGSGASITAVMGAVGVASLSLGNSGFLPQSVINVHGLNNYPLVFSGGGGSGASGHANFHQWGPNPSLYFCSAVVLDTPGSGYTSTPSVTWNNSSFPATVIPTFGITMPPQVVSSLILNSGGSGYPASTGVPLNFSSAGMLSSPVGVMNTNSSGVGISTGLTSGGSFTFGYVPSVSVAQGQGAAALAHIWPFVNAGTTLAVFQNRAFLGGGQLLQWSGTGATTGYNNQGYDDFLTADLSGALQITDADLVHNITALRSFNNYLWIVGDQSIKQIGSLFPSGAPPFQLLTLSSDQGTIWPKSCVSFNRIFLFANPNGIFGVFGSTVQKISDDLDGIFQNASFAQQVQSAIVDLNSKHNAVFMVRYNDPVAGTRSLLLMFDGKRWWFANQGAGLVTIITRPLFATDINQMWGSVTGTDLTQLFADPTTAQPFKLSTALAHADNPVQGKRVIRAGFTADANGAGSVNMLLEADNVALSRAFAVTATSLLVGGANDANNNPVAIAGVYIGATITGTLANFTMQNVILEYQEISLWKGA